MSFKDTLRVMNKELRKLSDYEPGMQVRDVEYYDDVNLAYVSTPSGEEQIVIFDAGTLELIEGGYHIMKRNFKTKDIYTTKSQNTTPYTAKHILNTLYGKLQKEDIMNYREECLRMANEIVNGAREKDYGTPEDNFHTIADLWTAYLNYPISTLDVANMMVMLKIARAKTGNATDDCFVDMAGYSACAYELYQAKYPIDPTEGVDYKDYKEGEEIKFDDCAWGNPDYGDISMDDGDSYMINDEYPKEHDESKFEFRSDDPANILFDTDGNSYRIKTPRKQEEDVVDDENHGEEKFKCYDAFSGLYFESTIKELTEITTSMNKILHDVGFVNIRSFYNALKLDPQMSTIGLGWCVEKNDHVIVSYYSRLESDGKPCLIIAFEPIKYLNYISGEFDYE